MAISGLIVTQVGRSVPDHFSVFGHQTFVLILVVQATEEHAIKAHLSKHGSHLPGVAKGIDLPSNARTATFSESVVQKSEILQPKLVIGS